MKKCCEKWLVIDTEYYRKKKTSLQKRIMSAKDKQNLNERKKKINYAAYLVKNYNNV